MRHMPLGQTPSPPSLRGPAIIMLANLFLGISCFLAFQVVIRYEMTSWLNEVQLAGKKKTLTCITCGCYWPCTVQNIWKNCCSPVQVKGQWPYVAMGTEWAGRTTRAQCDNLISVMAVINSTYIFWNKLII